MSTPTITTFRFQRPRFLTAVLTESDVLTEWLCFLIGSTLTDIPGSFISITSDSDGLDRTKDFEASIHPGDLDRSRTIIEEVQKHYSDIWDEDVFRAYNFSDEGFHYYDYTIQPHAISFTFYPRPASEDDDQYLFP